MSQKRIQWNTQLFVERSAVIHNGKYKYPETYINALTPIVIECPIHGHFKQQPRHHLNGRGCPTCFHEKSRSTIDDFVEKANEIHNGKYTYPCNYINSRTLITISCPIHGLFEQKPPVHLEGKGCPSCGDIARSEFIMPIISKMEIDWLDSLGIPQEYRQASLKIGRKIIKADAFVPPTNTVYEFYGDYWHGNPLKFSSHSINSVKDKTFGELYQATLAREQLIVQAGYKIISIWELDWNNQ